MAEPGTVDIGGGHYLSPLAAATYLLMREDGCPAGITSSTRSYALQLAYYRNQGRPGWPAKADNPDRSKHVWRPGAADEGGRALDLPDIGGVMNPKISPRAWVREHGARYGWMKDRVSREPWHMEFEAWRLPSTLVARADRILRGPVPEVPNLTLPDPIEEIVMRETFVGIAPDGKHYLINLTEGLFEHVLDEAELGALGKRYGEEQVPLEEAGVAALAAFAARVRRRNAEAAADAIWSRPVTVAGQRVTVGAAVQQIANRTA